MTFNEIYNVAPFKANIFIDWLNVNANGGQGLDFFKLMEFIRKIGGTIYIANIYVPAPENGKVNDFYHVMQKAGLKLIFIHSKWNRVNCDAMMAVDMVTQSQNADVIYLLSNDADFIPAVGYLQSTGKRVLLIHSDKPSCDLRKAVDESRHLGQLDLLRTDENKYN